MQTCSHLLMTGAIGAAAARRWRVAQGWFCLGAVAPDIPFYLVAAVWFGRKWLREPETFGQVVFETGFDWHYFHDPVWIVAYNLLHAPLDVLLLAGFVFWALRCGRSWGRALGWFVAGVALHVTMDLLTHHGDGPLLLFSFNWHLRWDSPVSYWDPRWHGVEFHRVALAADLIWGLAWLRLAWIRRRTRVSAITEGPPCSPKSGMKSRVDEVSE